MSRAHCAAARAAQQGVAAAERCRSAYGLPLALAAERRYVRQTASVTGRRGIGARCATLSLMRTLEPDVVFQAGGTRSAAWFSGEPRLAQSTTDRRRPGWVWPSAAPPCVRT